MIWLGGVDCGVWIADTCGLPCRMWVWGYRGTIPGEAKYQALLGWHLLVVCCVYVFCGVSWSSVDRASWGAIFGQTY